MCETIFVEELCTFTKRGAESALFLFSATHSTFRCSGKILLHKNFAKHPKLFLLYNSRCACNRHVYHLKIIFQVSTSVITAEKVRIICGACQITIPGHFCFMNMYDSTSLQCLFQSTSPIASSRVCWGVYNCLEYDKFASVLLCFICALAMFRGPCG